MKPAHLFALLLVFAAACSPFSLLAPTVSPKASPSVVDDLAPYRQDLISTAQHDVDQLDHPTRYKLMLTYDPAGPSLSGSEQAQYYNHESVSLNEIYFRLFANYPDSTGKITVSRVTADGAEVRPELQVQDTAMRVPLAKPLAAGSTVNFSLDFTVAVPRNSRAHYLDFTASDTVVTLPTVYPLIPAYDSRGWHIELPPPYGDLVYADISMYQVSITAPASMVVIASGSTVSTKDNSDGTKTWDLIGAPMRDFDINLTDKLQVSSSKVGETTVNSYYEASHAQSGQDGLKYATDALQDYEKRFGTYPYLELDVVETPTTAGGIEYPGLVVIGRGLYNNTEQRQYFEFATVHEVSHQWWYGMVGDDQVNYPWVDESLAQYSSLIYEQDIHGANAGQTILRQYFQNLYEQAKNAGHDAAVNQPVSAFNENDYGAIVYGKGPLFYDAIRTKMGDSKFFEFLQTYFQRFRYKIAFPEDILNTAQSTCGCNLQSEYNQWILSPGK
jgi:hypothetical protein